MRGKFIKPSIYFLLLALFAAACYQRFDSIEIKSANGKIVFSHPKIAEALKRGDVCVLGNLHLTKKSAEGDSREIWHIVRANDGQSRISNPIIDAEIIYGIAPPAMNVLIEPKLLTDGHYSIAGTFVIYNSKQEQLDNFDFFKEFDLTIDNAGNFSVTGNSR